MRAHSKMMTESPWESIEPGVARRVDRNGQYDFFWSRMPDRSPALVLHLGEPVKPVQPLPKLRHVGVFYRMVEGRNSYCLSLGERTHIDLFATLCRDVVEAAEAAGDLQSALQRAVRRTMRWHHLLRGGGRGLSIEEQRGLVGELVFLRELVGEVGALSAAEAWRGPEESAKDFELPGFYVECKARRSAAHPKVRISSEAQLTEIPGARLFLRVQDVDTALDVDGMTLTQHVERTAALFEDDILAHDVWDQRLSGTGYDPGEVEENRSWHLGTVRMFEVRKGFPRLVPPLPAGVEAVEYSIRLDDCTDFRASSNLNQLLCTSRYHV
ncbi:PD-(D/E)XK motif protein [uncultured Jannaschia sp.]|uniref:PD-(D/E)XK motif protein n=1 Tax=uncultured Jannaschia sp. TaxID=293347 RepID=UPI0026164AF4|nr:PD-(D/E)XK motif protein [uncultured Jannaschia sp.]